MTEDGTRPSTTFRIFVSSTFSDLKAERDALQRFVFPRLRELCASRGARFQAIDLRWGVSEEAGLDQRTMPICLAEIERCQRVTPRPNFIVLLGDRYGWRPLPPEIPASEFAAIEAKVAAADDRTLLSTWYRLDENAVPPAWCLQPRHVAVVEPAGPEARQAAVDHEAATWGQVEARLHGVLSNAVAAAGFDEATSVRYVASATEQEILHGALQVPEAAGHVFGFFRTLTTAQGMELTRAAPTDLAVRDFLDGSVAGDGFVFDAESHARLAALKEGKLRPLLGDNVHDYRATWAPEGIDADHLGSLPEQPATLDECLALLDDPSAAGTLCLDVWRSLATLIRDELDRALQVGQVQTEIRAHEDFGRERCRHFVGRQEPLAAIAGYLAGRDAQPFAIVGEPGSGKSALLARATELAREVDPDAFVVCRFIGATPGSSDGRTLLDSLCRQVTLEYGGDLSTIPSEFNDLAIEFGKRLELATGDRPLIVVLDALDQLAGAARSLSWLPAVLPANVRLVVSTLPGECERALLAKRPAPGVATVEPMAAADAEALLSRWLEHAGRALQPSQRAEVLTRFGRSGGLPLFLRLAFEEARLWRSYTPAEETVLHEGVRGLLRQNLFPRLSEPANHGRVLVSHGLGYLAASRYGLSEDELLDVLSADRAVNTDFHDRSPRSPQVGRLPVVVWSRLYFDLAPYLAERSDEGTTLLAFYHDQLREAATAEYLAGERAVRRHAGLADYFHWRADPARDRSWTGGHARGLSELPYHLAEAGDEDELYSTLTDFAFLEHKAAEVAVAEHPGPDGTTTRTYAGVYRLQDDYDLALARLGGGAAGGRKPLIVSGVDLGQGLAIRCPWCNVASPLRQEWRGTDIACPNPDCTGPLRVNAFVVERGRRRCGRGRPWRRPRAPGRAVEAPSSRPSRGRFAARRTCSRAGPTCSGSSSTTASGGRRIPSRGFSSAQLQRRSAPGAAPWLRARTRFRESEALRLTLAGHIGQGQGLRDQPRLALRRHGELQRLQDLGRGDRHAAGEPRRPRRRHRRLCDQPRFELRRDGEPGQDLQDLGRGDGRAAGDPRGPRQLGQRVRHQPGFRLRRHGEHGPHLQDLGRGDGQRARHPRRPHQLGPGLRDQPRLGLRGLGEHGPHLQDLGRGDGQRARHPRRP